MKCGRTDSKKIIFHTDILWNANQDQLWAILDTVDSDFEEDIDNLIVDSNTEFETITYDATALMNNVEEAKSSKMHLLTENVFFFFFFFFLFNCLFDCPRSTLGHSQGEGLTNPILTTTFNLMLTPEVTGSLVARLGP